MRMQSLVAVRVCWLVMGGSGGGTGVPEARVGGAGRGRLPHSGGQGQPDLGEEPHDQVSGQPPFFSDWPQQVVLVYQGSDSKVKIQFWNG